MRSSWRGFVSRAVPTASMGLPPRYDEPNHGVDVTHLPSVGGARLMSGRGRGLRVGGARLMSGVGAAHEWGARLMSGRGAAHEWEGAAHEWEEAVQLWEG